MSHAEHTDLIRRYVERNPTLSTEELLEKIRKENPRANVRSQEVGSVRYNFLKRQQQAGGPKQSAAPAKKAAPAKSSAPAKPKPQAPAKAAAPAKPKAVAPAKAAQSSGGNGKRLSVSEAVRMLKEAAGLLGKDEAKRVIDLL